MSSSISWRVARTQELHALQADPLSVSRSEETTCFCHLSNPHDDALRAVLVLLRQVDLIAKEHEPPTWLQRPHDESIRGLHGFAIELQGLHKCLWHSTAGEVQGGQLETWQRLESRHESHCLATPRRSTENKRSLLLQPRPECSTMSHRVDGGDHKVSIGDLGRIDIDGGHALRPRVPLAVLQSNLEVQQRDIAAETVRHGNRGLQVAQLVAETHTDVKAHVSTKGPHHGEHQILGDVSTDDILRQGELLMQFVVLGHHTDSLSQESKKTGQTTDVGECHHVFLQRRNFQSLEHHAAKLKVGL
mmetsp:Transcript_13007/g.35949  ORF Transcript_13007/g.35949 Transcript_13007/m.35949 type:complete len:303 (+) Transcript_13007:343-1251(+)